MRLTKSENIFNRNYCQIFVDCPLVQQYDEPTLKECQKTPITVSKDTYYSVKRDQLLCQKRPITVSKETYYGVKRVLLQKEEEGRGKEEGRLPEQKGTHSFSFF